MLKHAVSINYLNSNMKVNTVDPSMKGGNNDQNTIIIFSIIVLCVHVLH